MEVDILHGMRLDEILTENVPTHAVTVHILFIFLNIHSCYNMIGVGTHAHCALPTKFTEFILFRTEL